MAQANVSFFREVNSLNQQELEEIQQFVGDVMREADAILRVTKGQQEGSIDPHFTAIANMVVPEIKGKQALTTYFKDCIEVMREEGFWIVGYVYRDIVAFMERIDKIYYDYSDEVNSLNQQELEAIEQFVEDVMCEMDAIIWVTEDKQEGSLDPHFTAIANMVVPEIEGKQALTTYFKDCIEVMMEEGFWIVGYVYQDIVAFMKRLDKIYYAHSTLQA